MGFIIGFIVGAGMAAWMFYRFYHVNVVSDLKAVIDELKIELDKKK
jgi:hypothetical protein